MSDIERITSLIKMIRSRQFDYSKIDDLEFDDKDLQNDIQELAADVMDANSFMLNLADGNLSVSSKRRNMFLGPLKDLQSSLRHMLWQMERLSQGDFSNKVEFLGDYSRVFNQMITEIEVREILQKRNSELEKKNLEQQNYMLSEQVTHQIEYYDKIQEVHLELRKFRHDIKNHYLSLYNLLEENKIDSAKEYLNSISKMVSEPRNYILNTGNPLFDSLISDKVSYAKKNGITVDAQVLLTSKLDMDNFDICVLFGNAFDNAIEACLSIESDQEKIIRFQLKTHRKILNVVLSNTANEPKIDDLGDIQTSKEDSQNHGFGLKNIASIVDKYHGVLQKGYSEGFFTLTFMLCDVIKHN